MHKLELYYFMINFIQSASNGLQMSQHIINISTLFYRAYLFGLILGFEHTVHPIPFSTLFVCLSRFRGHSLHSAGIYTHFHPLVA